MSLHEPTLNVIQGIIDEGVEAIAKVTPETTPEEKAFTRGQRAALAKLEKRVIQLRIKIGKDEERSKAQKAGLWQVEDKF
jgi:hypothetical protein